MKTFRKGGSTNEAVQSIAKQKTNHGTIQFPNANLNKYIGKRDGGLMKKDMMKDDVAQDKKVVKKAIGMHDTQLHGGKKTNLTKLAKGGMARMSAKGEHAVQKQSKRGAEMVKMAKAAPAMKMASMKKTTRGR